MQHDWCVVHNRLNVVKRLAARVALVTIRDQLLHHLLSIRDRVIECDQCLCHTTSPSCMFISVRYTLNLYVFAT